MATIWYHPLIKSIKREWVLQELYGCGKRAGIFTDIQEYPGHQFPRLGKSDMLVIWNRHLNQDKIAKTFEDKGLPVLLLENPYVQVPQITRNYNPWVSVSKGFHNNPDTSFKCLDSGQRWDSFNLRLNDWKQVRTPRKILVCTQAKEFDGEGLGFGTMKQPKKWDSNVVKNLLHIFSEAQIVFRTHPNSKKLPVFPKHERILIEIGSAIPLRESLCDNDIDLTVVYTSNSSIESLMDGIPVVYSGPNIFLQKLCSENDAFSLKINIDRFPLFHKLAWNQFSLQDFRSGLFYDQIYPQLKQ